MLSMNEKFLPSLSYLRKYSSSPSSIFCSSFRSSFLSCKLYSVTRLVSVILMVIFLIPPLIPGRVIMSFSWTPFSISFWRCASMLNPWFACSSVETLMSPNLVMFFHVFFLNQYLLSLSTPFMVVVTCACLVSLSSIFILARHTSFTPVLVLPLLYPKTYISSPSS